MKFVLKEKRINEEKEGDKYYLYHATVTKPDLSFLHSFRQGIRTNASVGIAASQGAGFYLFSSYEDAYNRLKSEMLVNVTEVYTPFNPERDGYPMLVTIEVSDLDPTKFDIDSEVSSKLIVDAFIKNLKELNEKLPINFKILRIPSRQDAVMLKIGNDRKTVSLGMEPDGYTAEIIGKFCAALEEHASELWHKIEKSLFDSAEAIKYVGKDLILPYKIEVMDENGRLHDCTTKDAKFLKGK